MQGTTNSISGFLNVDKPSDWTSSDVVAKLRSAFQLRKRRLKIGHGGTLDPMATGVLLICIGSATRLAQFVLSGNKTYVMSVKLGTSTDTYDSEGMVTDRQDYMSVTLSDLQSILPEFSGEIDQIPPMYSAIKRHGQPLYKLARQGKTIPREPRKVQVYGLEMTAWSLPSLELKINCGSGFYARSLANDIGQRLGCGAHMTALRRERAGDFDIADSLSLDKLIATAHDDWWMHHLIQPDHVLKHLNAVTLDDAEAFAFLHGQEICREVSTNETDEHRLRVYADTGELLGLARIDDGSNMIHPATVFGDAI